MTQDDPEGEAVTRALVRLLPGVGWEAVALAAGYAKLLDGSSLSDAARAAYETGPLTLKRASEKLETARHDGFVASLTERKKTGSAENPVTKLFPARITEQRFAELLDGLKGAGKSLDYADERDAGHTHVDFVIKDARAELPINVKNAGTRFERAAELVGLNPDDCIPIPAYKAYGALETAPSLIYAVAVDFGLTNQVRELLPTLLTEDERIVWGVIGKYAGSGVQKAEDVLVAGVVRRQWDKIRSTVRDTPFRLISARRATRILETNPKRTPGIGLRAWGTGANAEVNVHISVEAETTPWEDVQERITSKGVSDVVEAVNRRKQVLVYDPEI